MEGGVWEALGYAGGAALTSLSALAALPAYRSLATRNASALAFGWAASVFGGGGVAGARHRLRRG